ncbi:hypothetical protein FGIG_05628 [Fasciola gigantica]|uniref:G-protein coupled receptors family 1 profile domain-containing protein n=1 Tax=Fasciola gigantica TaxID=46835 RepID=A0A504Z496_FASGI|nr:hypothetical protein FGIG_05628 [Fasciola gigantica]
MAEFFQIQSYFWMFCAYILPGLFIIICHVIVIKYVHSWPSNSRENNEQRDRTRNKLQMLFITTATMASMLLILHAYEAIRYLLANAGVISYSSGSPEQQIGIGLIILTCTLNPVIMISTTHILRNYIHKLLFKAVSSCINLSRNPSISTVDTTDF